MFSGVSSIRKLLKVLINARVIEEFGGKKSVEAASGKAWNALMDSDLELAETKTTLKNEIDSRLLRPQIAKEFALTRTFQRSISPADHMLDSNFSPIYSCILYGPPGTAVNSSLSNEVGFK